MQYQSLEETLPKEFNACPHCGSTERAAEQAAREGGLPDPERACLDIIQLPVMKALRPFVVLAEMDLCLGCGALYAKRIGTHLVKMEVIKGPPPGGPGRLFRR